MQIDNDNLIAGMDKVLALLREEWLHAKFEEKPKWMGKIDLMLEERFKLMKLRDASQLPGFLNNLE